MFSAFSFYKELASCSASCKLLHDYSCSPTFSSCDSSLTHNIGGTERFNNVNWYTNFMILTCLTSILTMYLATRDSLVSAMNSWLSSPMLPQDLQESYQSTSDSNDISVFPTAIGPSLSFNMVTIYPNFKWGRANEILSIHPPRNRDGMVSAWLTREQWENGAFYSFSKYY